MRGPPGQPSNARWAAIAAASGVSDMCFRLFVLAPALPTWRQLLIWLLIAGPGWGLLRTWAWAAGVWVAGRLLGGTGTFPAVLGAFARALLPLVALNGMWLLGLVVFGRAFFMLHVRAEAGELLALAVFGAALLAGLIALLWSFRLLARGVGALSGMGTWRALLAIVLGLAAEAGLAAAVLLLVG